MKRKIIIAGIIISVLLIGLIFMQNAGKGTEVEAYEAKKGNITRYVEDIGTIKSRNERKIYSNSTGEIKEIKFQVGDKIKAGDILVELDIEELELRIKSLEAQMEGLRATYKEAIKPVDSSKIEQAKTNVDTAKLNLEEARRQADNNKKLYEEGGISFNAYQISLNNLKQQENALNIAQSELELLQKGVSGNIKNQYEAQIADLAYQIQILENSRNDYIIKAPIDGIVMDVYVKEGAVVQLGMEIIEIGNEDNLYIEADILASDIGKIKEEASVTIENEDIGIENAKGKIEKIHPKAFSKTSDLGIEQKRVRIEISIENIASLKPGYEVDVNIFEAGAKDVISVPENSIFYLDDVSYVFVIDNNTSVLRKVEIGIEGEDLVEIKSGLVEGERVIVSPHKDLEEGMKVNIKE